MLIDPIYSVAFENEPEEPGLMEQSPRPMNEQLIGTAQVVLAVAQGLVLLLTCLLIYPRCASFASMYVRRATTRSRRDGGSYFTYRLVRSERVSGLVRRSCLEHDDSRSTGVHPTVLATFKDAN